MLGGHRLMILRFPARTRRIRTVAVATIVDYVGGLLLPDTPSTGAATTPTMLLEGFRHDFYQCLDRRADALFELADAVLCADGPVRSLPGLSLVAEHRRGHGALYDALAAGRVDVERLRTAVASAPLPRAADGRIVLAVDVTCWLRPEAHTSPQRIMCHTYGRGKDQHIGIPGWPYSFVVALETGRSSWTAPLDAVRLAPGADLAVVTARQVRAVVSRLVAAGHWQPGDRMIWVVMDAGGVSDGLCTRSSMKEYTGVHDTRSAGWVGGSGRGQ